MDTFAHQDDDEEEHTSQALCLIAPLESCLFHL